jgi:hypothetical protein
MNGTDDRTRSGSSRHIVHAPLVQATETDRSPVKESLQPPSIDTRTCDTQCNAESVGSLRWFAKERGARITVNDNDE